MAATGMADSIRLNFQQLVGKPSRRIPIALGGRSIDLFRERANSGHKLIIKTLCEDSEAQHDTAKPDDKQGPVR